MRIRNWLGNFWMMFVLSFFCINTTDAITIENEAITVLKLDKDHSKDGKRGKVLIYPNPVDKVLYLGQKIGFQCESHALLTTISGNVIAQLFPHWAQGQMSFDLSNVPNGTYHIISKTSVNNDALQVVVQH